MVELLTPSSLLPHEVLLDLESDSGWLRTANPGRQRVTPPGSDQRRCPRQRCVVV